MDYIDSENIEQKIDSAKAQELTRRFLSQYHTVIDTKVALEKDVWIVTAYLGFANTQTRKVRIDANSGQILGYT